jgi:hypothetical protein
MLVVEVHQLDVGDREACSFDDVRLDGGVGDVLGLDPGGGLDLGDDPGVAFFRESVYRDEDVVFEEGGLEDGGGAGGEGLACGFDGALGAAVVKVDEGGVWELLAGALSDAVAHVEDGLEGGVRAELRGAGLVGFPPELAVALEAGGEARFGEAVGHGLARL